MALLAVEGTYRDGKIELTETPADVEEARVTVIFWPARLPEASAETAAENESARQEAWDRLLARMKRGYHLGGGRPYERREDLYDRHDHHDPDG